MNKKEDEAKELLQHFDIKKYSIDNGYFPGFPTLESTNTLFDNYYIFLQTAKSYQIYKKINDLLKKYKNYRNDKDKIVRVDEETENIKKVYEEIMKEAEDNYKFYEKLIMVLYWDYHQNYWKNGVGKIFDKITTGILSMLNKNYIYYESKIVDICCKLNELNLTLTNKF